MLTLDYPRDRDIHTVADFAELLCLLNSDRACSRDMLGDVIGDAGDRKISEDELEDCFSHLKWRQNAFGERYPFTLDQHCRCLFAHETQTDLHRLYSLLLVCANLSFIPAKSRASFPEVFERIAFLTLQASWPEGAITKAFGKNESDYVGKKSERINMLATQIGGRGVCGEHTFRSRDSGDGGIDLVAWHDLDEHEKRNIPSALAQCACSRTEWSKKQGEIMVDRLVHAIAPTHKWNQVMIIPQSFRDNHGCWAASGDVGGVILFDRLRIVNQLSSKLDWDYLSPPEEFDVMLSERSELV